jgi:hypothetical protein
MFGKCQLCALRQSQIERLQFELRDLKDAVEKKESSYEGRIRELMDRLMVLMTPANFALMRQRANPPETKKTPNDGPVQVFHPGYTPHGARVKTDPVVHTDEIPQRDS